jgi:hypothetical protein
MRATVEYHENSQRKVNRPVNTLDPVMDPSSKHLGFVLPDVSSDEISELCGLINTLWH